MNRAFIREPDDSVDPRCPECGVIGLPVPRHTVVALAREDALGSLSESALFCASAHCKVVYYDANGQTLGVAAMRRPVWPKDPAAPVCGCFGVPAELIEEDARAGRKEALRLLAPRAAESPTRCERRSASGRCCLPDVQRVFLRASHGERGDAG